MAHWKTITSIQRPKNICNWLELMCWGLRPQSLLFLLLSFVSVFYVLFIYAKGILCFKCCFYPWKHTDLDFGSGLCFLSIWLQTGWKSVFGWTMTGFHRFLSSLKNLFCHVCKSCWNLWFSFKIVIHIISSKILDISFPIPCNLAGLTILENCEF